jgi:hypothetical protein
METDFGDVGGSYKSLMLLELNDELRMTNYE